MLRQTLKTRAMHQLVEACYTRYRNHQSSGQDHWICPHCHEERGLWKPWHPNYGVVYDEMEIINRGKYRSRRDRAPPRESIDMPFGPPPEEYLYCCPVGGEEMLVNEAIINVAVGAATFQGAYQGGLPKIGCPGCSGETMEYVDHEA